MGKQTRNGSRQPCTNVSAETVEDHDPLQPSKVPQTEGKPVEASASEQSGSAGRPTGGKSPGKSTGQGHYGQSGFGGAPDQETDGQALYRESAQDGSEAAKKKDKAVAPEHTGTQQQDRKPRPG